MKNLLLPVCLWLIFAVSIRPAIAQPKPLTSPQIDALVEQTLTAFEVPGIAVAVVKDGQVVHSRGYGVRSLRNGGKVDENTLFGIASNSKAFTAAALGILMDEGKLRWDDKVIDYVPEFRLYTPYVTDAFTIRDLLTHRSGLGLGAGDLMFWPDSTNFTMTDVLHNLRYLKPTSAFRTKFDYDNLLYMVAGEVIERVSGKSWEAFVETRIMQPLNMTNSAGSWKRVANRTNAIDAHARVDGTVRVIRRDSLRFGQSAGGINSSVADMSQWVMAQLNGGKYGPDGSKRLFSPAVHNEMWTPQTILPVSPTPRPPYNTHFSAYGLGWFLSDVAGLKQVTHTGGLSGMVTQVTLFPERKLGIIVFTNQESGGAFSAITNTIKDSYLGLPATDWVDMYSKREQQGRTEADSITRAIWTNINNVRKTSKPVPFSDYAGTYRDEWLGDVVLYEQGGKQWFRSVRSPKLTGEVFPYKNNTFVVKWNLRSMNADAYLTFAVDENMKPVSITMKPISPLTDFSYDFQDLDLRRVRDNRF